jgi:glutamine amidotransferase
MIAVVDYKVGNLVSVKKALDRIGAQADITSDPEVVRAADRVILPGVGHFAATETLTSTGLRGAITESIAAGKPYLGICVGMQWLFESSEEAPGVPGLGLFEGMCQRFRAGIKSPHVGWNDLKIVGDSKLLRDIASPSFVYYTHSYRAPLTAATIGQTEYGGEFSGAVERDNVWGVQFHPEKSGDVGLRILQNFCSL